MCVLALGAAPASAALQKLDVRRVSLNQFENASPPVFVDFVQGDGVSLIDASQAHPRLRKLLIASANQSTTAVPSLAGFVWFSQLGRMGPNGTFTGTGSSASSLAWGSLSGWTITGGTFCHAQPSFICDLAVAAELVTVDPTLRSSFYDIGTWIFHGTGFTAAPFIYFTVTLPGNQQIVLRGATAQDGTLPALSAAVLVALAAAVLAREFAARRRA